MIFFKTIKLLIISFMLIAFNANADNHDKKKKLVDQVKAINENLEEEEEDEDEVPLNDPFAGNEGSSSIASNLPVNEEDQGAMSLYNFKLVGLISGKDHSYITLVNSAGEIHSLFNENEMNKLFKKFKIFDSMLVSINNDFSKEKTIFKYFYLTH